MVIELLPAIVTAIRAAAIANDTKPAAAADGEAPATGAAAAAPVDAPEAPPGPPLVRALRRRPGMRYATAGNVILPLAFAERMPGWRARSAPRL